MIRFLTRRRSKVPAQWGGGGAFGGNLDGGFATTTLYPRTVNNGFASTTSFPVTYNGGGA